MYRIFTDRFILTVSHPKMAWEVCQFNRRNRKFLQETEPTRPEEYYTLKGVRESLKYEDKQSRHCAEFRFWITEKNSSAIIGTVCLSSVIFGSVKSCFLSYKVDENFQGKGVATEAVKEAVDFAFKILRLHRIEAYVMPKNKKSIRVMEKLNFEEEGISRKCLEVNGRWEDHIRFSLLNPLGC